jgi:hypothetical protein
LPIITPKSRRSACGPEAVIISRFREWLESGMSRDTSNVRDVGASRPRRLAVRTSASPLLRLKLDRQLAAQELLCRFWREQSVSFGLIIPVIQCQNQLSRKPPSNPLLLQGPGRGLPACSREAQIGPESRT